MSSEHADGTLSARNGRYVLRFERHLPHPADQVWQALTEPDALRHWFPQEVDGDMSAGGKLTFSFAKGENVPDGEGGCRLIFTDTIIEQGKAARDGAGWHVCLDMLGAWLDGAAPPPPDRWQRVHPVYAERFGPAASTMGPPSAEAD